MMNAKIKDYKKMKKLITNHFNEYTNIQNKTLYMRNIALDILEYFQSKNVSEALIDDIVFTSNNIQIITKEVSYKFLDEKVFNILLIDIAKIKIIHKVDVELHTLNKNNIKGVSYSSHAHYGSPERINFSHIDIFILDLKNTYYDEIYDKILFERDKYYNDLEPGLYKKTLYFPSEDIYLFSLGILNYIKKLNLGFPEILVENNKIEFKNSKMDIKIKRSDTDSEYEYIFINKVKNGLPVDKVKNENVFCLTIKRCSINQIKKYIKSAMEKNSE